MRSRAENIVADEHQDRWTMTIQPKRRFLNIDLRELIRYRDLIWLFVNRDFVTVYKQTILGPAWFILNPLFTTIVYTFIFGGLAKIPTDGIPQVLFYYGGTMLWGYFSSCFNSGADTFTGNLGLFSKVYFPRLTVPISKAFSNLVSAAIQFATLICFYIYYKATGANIHLTWWAFALPVIFAALAVFGTGLGMIVSALATKYRDLRQLVSFGMTLWMYATPIVYPISQVPQRYRWISLANPVSVPIEGFRYAMYGVGSVSLSMVLICALVTCAALFFGLVLFNRAEQNFVDVA
jgi:homopolymeric O-antigen transport system permease protein